MIIMLSYVPFKRKQLGRHQILINLYLQMAKTLCSFEFPRADLEGLLPRSDDYSDI